MKCRWCRGDLGKRVLRDGCHRVGGRGLGCLGLTFSHRAGFSSTLDSLVAVLVVRSKVFEKFPVGFGDLFTRAGDLSESHCELLESLLVKVVLVRLWFR
jgi:hypothetical protein